MTDVTKLRRQSAEVYYTRAPFAVADIDTVDLLKRLAEDNPRKRCRLCFHADPSAAVHEMLIVHHRSAYVRPHWHVGKTESLAVVEGEALGVVFAETGDIAEVFPLASYGAKRCYYYHMPERTCHSLLIESEWLVFQETTAGPFNPTDTGFPTWAPDGRDPEIADTYRLALLARTRDFIRNREASAHD